MPCMVSTIKMHHLVEHIEAIAYVIAGNDVSLLAQVQVFSGHFSLLQLHVNCHLFQLIHIFRLFI